MKNIEAEFKEFDQKESNLVVSMTFPTAGTAAQKTIFSPSMHAILALRRLRKKDCHDDNRFLLL